MSPRRSADLPGPHADDFEVIDAVSTEAFSASVTIRDGSADISKQALRNLPVPVAPKGPDGSLRVGHRDAGRA